jgi:2,5-dioxopentanoate dehydrogenase
MDLNGRSRIGYNIGVETGDRFQAFNPATGAATPPVFYGASDDEVRRSGDLAGEAFAAYRATPPSDRARFLRAIAQNIEELGEPLVVRATSETGLPNERIRSERARTCSQLRLFADLIEEGSWVDARIDTAEPERKPVAKPDVRSMLRPLGPVVVFGASNFPLAFSVAGGDTASALAAGNPVVVKAHAAHPGTAALVADAVLRAARDCGMPNGVFSLIFGAGARVGTALVQHPAIQAGGFTGSRAAGRKLVKLANNRPQPIPFYAEMSSTNPVFILPGALRERAETLAAGLHGSFTLGAGQFCTKPGMVFLSQGSDADAFTRKLQQLVGGSTPFHLLTKTIHSSYGSAIATRTSDAAVRLVAEGPQVVAGPSFAVNSALFETDATSFLDSNLETEIFGPTTLLVQHSSRDQVLAIARSLEGHLTATIHGTEQDMAEFADLIAVLANKVGRLVFNGFPTGVEVTHAMVHGGPYPSTSDGRSTSVGSQAIFRFARLVCYQGFPDTALPDALKNDNPLGIWRMVDGEMSRR